MIINSFIENQEPNLYIYNLNLTLTKDVLSQFSGIKHVFLQGSSDRARKFACRLANTTDINQIKNLFSGSSYFGYRVDDILLVSHGMGTTSIMTLLHSLSKVLYYAGSHDVKYIRIGTSGGIGIEPGSVVITETAYMPNLVPGYQISGLGRDVIYPTGMSYDLNQAIFNAQPKNLPFKVVIGNSIAADDFYLGQARFDGAIQTEYSEDDRKIYFSKLKAHNIVNFEMESTALASFCNRAEIEATMIAVTLLDRTQGDQIHATSDELAAYADRVMDVAINYIKSIC